MSKVQHIDEIEGPVVVGRFYWVPTVAGQWFTYSGEWPVIGPKHNDKHCLNFHLTHYHLDARFLPAQGRKPGNVDFWMMVMSAPLCESDRLNAPGLPAPVLKKLKARRVQNPCQSHCYHRAINSSTFSCLHDEFAGRQSKRDDHGWVCPHRNVPLASQPVVDGVITCPLHLLRIDAATGKVLPRVLSEETTEAA